MSTIYKTKTVAQLRTRSGNKAGKTGIGSIIILSGRIEGFEGKNEELETWYEIDSANYRGKYIQMKYLIEHGDDPGPADPPPEGFTSPVGFVRMLDPDKRVMSNTNVIEWGYEDDID